MKSWSITQRLIALLVLVLALVLAGVVLLVRADRREAVATDQHDSLVSAADRLRFEMLDASDALRGLMLEPGSETERQRKLASDDHTTKTIEETRKLLQNLPEVGRLLEPVVEFDTKKLNPLENQILDLAGKDNSAALGLYNRSYVPARREQDQLIDAFVKSSETATDARVQAAKGEQQTAMWLLGGLFVLAAVAGVFFARALARPLVRLTQVAETVAAGDLAVVLVESEGGGEIAALNRAFARMIASLRTMAGQAEQIAAGQLGVTVTPQSDRDVMGNALAGMVAKLSALIGQVQRSGIQVNTSVNEIAATAKQQQATANEIASTTTEIGTTSKEISATSKELVKTVHEVTTVAEHTATLATNGQAGLTKMGDTMQHVMAAGASINAKLAVLNEKAGNINQVVTTISKVADQTNLLSLNAAIEAEKAGEYGRGFAVVATEIRRLADQTAVATVDIEQMVKEMQSAVSAGVMGMDKFSEEVRRGVAEVQQVSAQLAEIIQQVQALMPRFELVNEGMQAQSTGASQISEALAQLGEAARQTAESLRQSNEAISQLNDASGGLKASVEKFKLA